MNHALWVWEPEWEPRAEMDDEFNFLHGPDPDHHKNVSSSDLIDVILDHWARNSVRPSDLVQGPTTQGTLRNCPEADKWAISVWDGADDAETGQVLATCGAGAVDFAYYIDPDTQEWLRYFVGRSEISGLPTLDRMQGILAHGATDSAASAPTPASSGATRRAAEYAGSSVSPIGGPSVGPWALVSPGGE